MTGWLASLWQKWFGEKEEISLQQQPERSPPPVWNGGFVSEDQITRKMTPPRHRIEPTRFEDDDTEIADIVTIGAGLIASTDQISSTDDDQKWEGGGGGFSGGGASGGWDSSNDPSSSSSSGGSDD